MAVIDSDLSAVLAKMQAGEFVTIFIVKGDGAEKPDEVRMYPESGDPMPAEVVQQALAGFLKDQPVPLDETPNEDGTAYLNADEDGNAASKYSNLQWLVTWIVDHFRGSMTRGLEAIARDSLSDPLA